MFKLVRKMFGILSRTVVHCTDINVLYHFFTDYEGGYYQDTGNYGNQRYQNYNSDHHGRRNNGPKQFHLHNQGHVYQNYHGNQGQGYMVYGNQGSAFQPIRGYAYMDQNGPKYQ